MCHPDVVLLLDQRLVYSVCSASKYLSETSVCGKIALPSKRAATFCDEKAHITNDVCLKRKKAMAEINLFLEFLG